MKAEDLKKLLIGKTIKDLEIRSYMDRSFCVETILFEDGTSIEFEGYCDFASVCWCKLPGGEHQSIDPPADYSEKLGDSETDKR